MTVWKTDTETMEVFVELNNMLPSWAEFSVSKIDNFFAVHISIKCPAFGLKPFKVLTESTSLNNALRQAINMLRYYWIEKEEETEIINQIIAELKEEGIINDENKQTGSIHKRKTRTT